MEAEEFEKLRVHIAEVRQRLDAAAQGRAYTLLAATKTQSAELINHLPDCGILDYGENRVQEWMEKQEKIDKRMRYHQIGRLQTNKIKYIINKVVLVHSVDKQELAAEIQRQAEKNNRCVDILLQVNTAQEDQKGGVAPCDLMRLYEECIKMNRLCIKGLMCMAPNTQETDVVRAAFADARKCFDALAAQDRKMDTLSMGMSQDAEIALQEGSTLVRLGTSLFGKRTGY